LGGSKIGTFTKAKPCIIPYPDGSDTKTAPLNAKKIENIDESVNKISQILVSGLNPSVELCVEKLGYLLCANQRTDGQLPEDRNLHQSSEVGTR